MSKKFFHCVPKASAPDDDSEEHVRLLLSQLGVAKWVKALEEKVKQLQPLEDEVETLKGKVKRLEPLEDRGDGLKDEIDSLKDEVKALKDEVKRLYLWKPRLRL
jgi:predicted RNase H-like nuclease (RuvC/YqgF family)